MAPGPANRAEVPCHPAVRRVCVPNGCHLSPADNALAGAHRLALEHGIFDRPLGVAGIWGAIIRRWLDDLLPPNAVELCSGRVRLVVTEVHSFATLCCAARATSRLCSAVRRPGATGGDRGARHCHATWRLCCIVCLLMQASSLRQVDRDSSEPHDIVAKATPDSATPSLCAGAVLQAGVPGRLSVAGRPAGCSASLQPYSFPPRLAAHSPRRRQALHRWVSTLVPCTYTRSQQLQGRCKICRFTSSSFESPSPRLPAVVDQVMRTLSGKIECMIECILPGCRRQPQRLPGVEK